MVPRSVLVYSTFLRLPLGAGSMRGVYVTVLVTTSRMCRTLLRDAPLVQLCAGPTAGLLASAYLRALRAASQSNGERTERALKGDRIGESRFPAAGDGGTFRLEKVVGPVAGAESG